MGRDSDGVGGQEPFVALFHTRAKGELPEKGVKIILSGWEFEKPIRRIGPNEYLVALSDHSDFQGLMEYVEKSKAGFVITDGSRVGDAQRLAPEIQSRLGIPAHAIAIPATETSLIRSLRMQEPPIPGFLLEPWATHQDNSSGYTL